MRCTIQYLAVPGSGKFMRLRSYFEMYMGYDQKFDDKVVEQNHAHV